MEITEAHIILTGGGNGIGKFLTEYFSKKVKAIAILDKDENALNTLKEEYPTVDTVSVNLTDAFKTKECITALFQQSNEWNVLINNAGIIRNAPLFNPLNRDNPSHDISLWQETIDANLSSTFYTAAAFVENMAKNRNKGVVINMSSISAEGNAGQSAYAAAKAGVSALSKVWAKELGMWGIRSAAIAPGFFDTPSTHEALSEKNIEHKKQQVPLRRLGKLNEIAQAVQFVIENEYYNGKVLSLDGGLHI